MSTVIIVDSINASGVNNIEIEITPTLGVDSSGVVDAILRAEVAADAAEVSETNAAASETTAVASAASATASEASAAASASSASQSSSSASTSADTAASEAIVASEAAEESVNNSILMNAAYRESVLAQNNEKYAASGFVHYGERSPDDDSAINEGMFVNSDTASWESKIGLGRLSSSGGVSKTGSPYSHIAGVVSKLSKINLNSSQTDSWVTLPPAPDGTVIYDSTGDARGSGSATLDLKVDQDPKYGNVPTGSDAQIRNEAVARAFEGTVKNGDFRLGDNGDWSALGDTLSTSGGVATITNTNTAGTVLFIRQNSSPVTGSTFKCQARRMAGSGNLYIGTNVGDITTVDSPVPSEWYDLKVTTSASVATVTIGSSSGNALGSQIEIRNVSLVSPTEEVVTDRVDMFGLEQFDMVMKDDEVFDLIQSQSTTFGDTDVPTVDSIRPDSFFAAYDGQTGISKGKCVKWSTLTDVQKRKVAAYMKERLWVNEDGELTFTTIRQRSFAGSGNGDWRNIDSSGNAVGVGGDTTRLVRHAVGAGKYVKPHGQADVAPDNTDGYPIYDANSTYPVYSDGGVFSAYKSSNAGDDSAAYKSRCFFYVMGTVSRLNQGAFHPSLNAQGARTWVQSGKGWDAAWFEVTGVNTEQQCFIIKTAGDDITDAGVADISGYIGSTSGSGRNDGRLYDAIYADGTGGVVDYRMSAYPMDSVEESAKVWEKVKNGSYRGLESLVYTFVETSTEVGAATGVILDGGIPKSGLEAGGKIWIETSLGNYEERTITSFNYSTGAVNYDEAATRISNGHYIVSGILPTSVSGNFTMVDVIGDPANILLTDALKDGWQGSWIPVIPDGSGQDFPYTRKFLGGSTNTGQATVDNGATWVTGTWAVNSVTNTVAITAIASRVVILPYTAFAKQTVESTNKPVLNGEKGVGSVWSSSRSVTTEGALIAESLIGLILKDTNGENTNTNTAVSDFRIVGSTGAVDLSTKFNHTPLTLGVPTNNSPAVKALLYQIADNGQVSLGVHANELTYGSPTFINANSPTNSIVKNEVYLILSGAASEGLQGYTIRVTADNPSIVWANYIVINGVVCSSSTKLPSSVLELWNGSFWGDDSTMKITTSGSDTFVDLNGNTNISTVHELAIPYGWTSNHARAGEQTEGVDL